MEETKKVKITPRRLARQVAKHQLDRSHITGYNKERTGITGSKMPSTFSSKWKEIVITAMKPRNKKGAKKR